MEGRDASHRRPGARFHRHVRRQDAFAVVHREPLARKSLCGRSDGIGHARKYLTALIEIDFDAIADWARANDVAYTGFTSLAAHPAVQRLLDAEVARANRELSRVEQVKAFRILPKALDPEEDGEP
jgi:long-subunit acyl-CoA synthetase (AMP-forming)